MRAEKVICVLLVSFGSFAGMMRMTHADETSGTAAATPAPLTDRMAMARAHALFESQCGFPDRCSSTRDGRGACPHTVILLLPERVGAGAQTDAPASPAERRVWVCLNERGGLIGTHRGDNPPWRKG